ncbi:flagellar basal body-associated FliL family protein [Paenibacillus mucilaginosus]|uniref:Flagellar protein FliL n=3 Tax=Paenibacillus mucilaginosus TaxID=61624 RepID=H6NQ47_9BACL|nr:flagellar basal body-associated FliL family protein [Paenibacillus mucilaginosus]AEI44333.1 FliL [Paenibacillus mucilaginosus KNP414]AFC31871.1 FliL [Paenibacillus mucilaginosus 3016]AFH64228.1 flagellar basal body protein FliL [Paenibacillus mucilaginosus K02]AFK65444.1 flagellar basal body-associated protein FliL [Paenibacillus mucilaginosus K02]MCG7217613.1 flagellar basal body-associated FliL family protein [Paenibacillus mucilaginosus]
MFKSKIFIMVVAILIAITLILTAAFVLWNYMDKSSDPQAQAQQTAEQVKPKKKLKPEEIKANTAVMKDVLTNLSGGSKFIKVSLAFELESADGKAAFDLMDSQMKAIVIQTLADMKPEEVTGSKGFDNLGAALMNKMNPMLEEGSKVSRIMVTDIVLQ